MGNRVGARSLLQKIWSDHLVCELGDGMSLVKVDRVVLHERGGGLALRGLTDAGRTVRSPQTVFATLDHVVETLPGRTDATTVPGGTEYINTLRDATGKHGVELFDLDDPRQGIVHVISPEQGIALPGTTVACNDSHTCTVGGVGALGWGIGSSETEHVLATSTLCLPALRTLRLELRGALPEGVTAKDVALHVIGRWGAGFAGGKTIEYCGAVVERMTSDERLTLCNMAVELGARSGVVAPDEVTFHDLAGTPFAPTGVLWERALAHWRTLASDEEATWDSEATVDCGRLSPQVTWGTSPAHVTGVDGNVPLADAAPGPGTVGAEQARIYMGLAPGTPLEGIPIDAAFIGSCTNGRISDLRSAARVLRGRKVASGVRALCVPGSQETKRRAEQEGLDAIFRSAGFEWRESGCSLCFHAGGENFSGLRVVTTTNRNFENRQGHRARSHLASPATVAASAVAGRITDVRRFRT